MKRVFCLFLALLLMFSLSACGDEQPAAPESTPTEHTEGTPAGEQLSLPQEYCGVWYVADGRSIEIRPDGIAAPDGYYTEFICSEDPKMIDVMQDGEYVFTVYYVDEVSILVAGFEGREEMYYVDGAVPEETDGGEWDGPMDEEERLFMAYCEAENDFIAAINNMTVYDDEGNVIPSSPELAKYLYDQFAALGDYLDASDYLRYFKTRQETVTTVHQYYHSTGGEVTANKALPDYDVMGQPVNTSVYIGVADSANYDIEYVYNDHNVIIQMLLTTKNIADTGTAVVIPEYNENGQQIAAHVELVDTNGNVVNYTSTYEYDDQGRLVRAHIPYYVHDEDTGKRTELWEYDASGRLLCECSVTVPDDLDLYNKYRYPLFSSASSYFYDENGLLTRYYHSATSLYTQGIDFFTYTLSYDENGLLVQKESYSFALDYDGMVNSGEYTGEEAIELGMKMFNDIFGFDRWDSVPEDWIRNEPFDLSKWEWIHHTSEPITTTTYTYSETTIMYIDLTPED